jgi:hypothetical protein
MDREVEMEIHAASMVQGNNHRRALVQKLNRQLPSNVTVTPDERDDDKVYDIMTATLTSVGTVTVSNPQLIFQTISMIKQNDQLVVNTMSGLADTSFVKINIDKIDLDLSMFNIDNRKQIDDSTVIIQAESPEVAEKIRERIRQDCQ